MESRRGLGVEKIIQNAHNHTGEITVKLQIVRLHAAAFIFSKNPKIGVSELAAEVEVSEGAIYRWVKLPEWDAALDALKFTGERKFYREPRRSLEREQGELVEKVLNLVYEGIRQGLSKKKAITRAAELLNIPRRRVYEWEKRNMGTTPWVTTGNGPAYTYPSGNSEDY